MLSQWRMNIYHHQAKEVERKLVRKPTVTFYNISQTLDTDQIWLDHLPIFSTIRHYEIWLSDYVLALPQRWRFFRMPVGVTIMPANNRRDKQVLICWACSLFLCLSIFLWLRVFLQSSLCSAQQGKHPPNPVHSFLALCKVAETFDDLLLTTNSI